MRHLININEYELIYRGVDKKINKFAPNKFGAFYEFGFSVTPDKKVAKQYGDKILTGRIKNNARIKTHADESGDITYLFDEDIIKTAKQNGYDGIRFINKVR